MFFLRFAWKLATLAGVFGVGYVVGREHSFEEEEEWNRENRENEEKESDDDGEESDESDDSDESDEAEESEVEFEFVDTDAESVSLVGCFNDWNKETNLMEKDGDVWKCTLNLLPGKYEYQFVVNDTDWKVDPKSEENVKNKYEGMNSIIEIK